MRKNDKIKIAAAAVLVLAFLIYEYGIPHPYVPSKDEIAVHFQLKTEDDIGLLGYDYSADDNVFGGGISNADKSMMKKDSDNLQTWSRQDLNCSGENTELSFTIRIITEYVTPNFENIYDEDITRYTNPITWNAAFGESYTIMITGNQESGYQAVLE